MNNQNIFKHFPGMVYRGIQKDQLHIEFVSDGVLFLTGYSVEELTDPGFNLQVLIHPVDLEEVIQETRLALENKRFFSCEYRILTKEGNIRYVWDRRYFDYDQPGSDGITFEGFVIDVSEKKLAEKALLQAQGFAKAVLDTAVEAIITINTKGIIESFNQSAQLMFNYRSSDVIGQNVKILMPQPFRQEHDGYLNNYVRTGRAQIIGIGREVIGLRKDGTQFPIYLSVSEVHHQTERKFVGLIRDLTEQRAAEIEAGEARDQLAHIDRLNMLNEMATGIAHEINQPLTAISMYAQTAIRMLHAPTPKPERLEEALNKMSAQAQRAGEVIERMQSMVRQEDSQREVTACNGLVHGIYKLAEVEAQIRDIVIDFVPADEECHVFCDSVQIQQVALNLLRNGMQAMDSVACKNGNHIEMTVATEKDLVKFSVIDRGTGISPQVEKILFEPFSSSKKQGLGIGLSLCRSIISAHGGQLGYNNNTYGGASFYFTLPQTDENTIEQDL